MDRILPEDDGPGASSTNALAYLEWCVRQPELSGQLDALSLGLSLLETTAAAVWQHGFVECSVSERDAVLERVQEIPHRSAQRFLVQLINLTLATFLSPPHMGANVNGIGWRYLGISPVTAPAATQAD